MRKPILSSHLLAAAFFTASAVSPAAAREKKPWFEIKASAGVAELRLRGYIGQASTYTDYWGEEHEAGGAGTLQEFEEQLLALGDVTQINLYLTSEGGDFPTAVAISSILARQKARIVCIIDGYAYSAAPVIACAADEIRAPSNAILMIHDAEFWCSGADEETLLKHIETLRACNASMIAAFMNKAGGTEEEWSARIKATTWLTGAQAKEIGLVDVLTEEVALSAYQPLKQVTAALRAPEEIRALIDKPTKPSAQQTSTSPTAMLRPRTPLFSAAAESPAAGGGSATPPAPAELRPQEDLASVISAAVSVAVTAAVKPIQEKLEKLEGAQAHVAGVAAHGIPQVTAAAPAPVAAAPTPEKVPVKTEGMTACQLIHIGRKTAGNA